MWEEPGKTSQPQRTGVRLPPFHCTAPGSLYPTGSHLHQMGPLWSKQDKIHRCLACVSCSVAPSLLPCLWKWNSLPLFRVLSTRADPLTLFCLPNSSPLELSCEQASSTVTDPSPYICSRLCDTAAPPSRGESTASPLESKWAARLSLVKGTKAQMIQVETCKVLVYTRACSLRLLSRTPKLPRDKVWDNLLGDERSMARLPICHPTPGLLLTLRHVRGHPAPGKTAS